MSTSENVFTPGKSFKLTATTSSQAVDLTGGGPNVVVFNADATIVIIVAFGDSTAVAVQPTATPTNGRHAVGPGSTQSFTMGTIATHIAILAESGTPIVHVSRGAGA